MEEQLRHLCLASLKPELFPLGNFGWGVNKRSVRKGLGICCSLQCHTEEFNQRLGHIASWWACSAMLRVVVQKWCTEDKIIKCHLIKCLFWIKTNPALLNPANLKLWRVYNVYIQSSYTNMFLILCWWKDSNSENNSRSILIFYECIAVCDRNRPPVIIGLCISPTLRH